MSKFTEENTKLEKEEKKKLIEESGKKDVKNKTEDEEEKNKKLDEYYKNINRLNDLIFKKSLSYEYFWRSLVMILLDSKVCLKW